MDNTTAGMLAWMWFGLVIGAIVLLVAWIIMPFAIIGTKPILRDVLAEFRTQNQLLRELKRSSEAPTPPAEIPPSLRSGPLFTQREVPHAPGAIGSESPTPMRPPA